MAVRCGDWEKSNILILRSIVCEISFCCPKCVTVSLIRNDSLGGEGRFHRRRLLSGGDGWGGVGGATAKDRSLKSWDHILPRVLVLNPFYSQHNTAVSQNTAP